MKKGWFGRLLGRTAAAPRAFARRGKGRYDAAQTNADNRRHWEAADALSADAANSSGVRATLRKRARYERDNSTYVNGIVQTLANDLIGTGPRLQMQTGDDKLDRAIELKFMEWAGAVGLAAEGQTTVLHVHHLDRGYESLDRKLGQLGAGIRRYPKRKKN